MTIPKPIRSMKTIKRMIAKGDFFMRSMRKAIIRRQQSRTSRKLVLRNAASRSRNCQNPSRKCRTRRAKGKPHHLAITDRRNSRGEMPSFRLNIALRYSTPENPTWSAICAMERSVMVNNCLTRSRRSRRISS